MSAADKRVAELLDRWLTSIELHAGYLKLDDAAYAKVQNWPKHERPTKWVIELAHARLVDLKRHLAERQALNDASFAEALELMSFLTTLLGSEHIERFIPLATKKPAEPKAAEVPPRNPPRGQRKPQSPPAEPAKATPEVPDRMAATVMGDAVRFLNWGREWPQLASLIARLADRPAEQEILKILRKHRAAIEAQARRTPP